MAVVFALLVIEIAGSVLFPTLSASFAENKALSGTLYTFGLFSWFAAFATALIAFAMFINRPKRPATPSHFPVGQPTAQYFLTHAPQVHYHLTAAQERETEYQLDYNALADALVRKAPQGRGADHEYSEKPMFREPTAAGALPAPKREIAGASVTGEVMRLGNATLYKLSNGTYYAPVYKAVFDASGNYLYRVIDEGESK